MVRIAARLINLLARFAGLMTLAILTPFVPIGSASACDGPLTGRALAPPSVGAFGKIHGLPPLELNANEYVLTVDDGPLPATTPRILEILRESCVHATFFFIGRRAEARPDLVAKAREEGNSVGSHSFTHPDFGKLDADARAAELRDGASAVSRALERAGLRQPVAYIRLPGSATPLAAQREFVAQARQVGIVAGYDISPEDWRNSPPAESLARFKKRMGDRGVVVVHDGQANTLLLLPMILDELRRRGAKVVALP